MYATIGHQIYDFGLSLQRYRVDDNAQKINIIDCKQGDQLQAVKKISQLISVHPLVYIVTRLISSLIKVMQCKRSRDDKRKVFVPCFRSLAAKQRLYVGFSMTSTVSEIPATTLLSNAILSDETLTNAILQLIPIAEARKNHDPEDEVTVSRDAHRKKLKILDKLSKYTSNDDAPPQPSENAYNIRRKTVDMVHGIKEILKPNRDLIQTLISVLENSDNVDNMFSTPLRR